MWLNLLQGAYVKFLAYVIETLLKFCTCFKQQKKQLTQLRSLLHASEY